MIDEKNNDRIHRLANYDWMRVFAMCMVILNHVADSYLIMYQVQDWHPSKVIYICEGISHCAVPLFLMLTGTFVIEKAGRTTAKEFYLKSIKKLGIPFVIFVILYYAYDFYNGEMTLPKFGESLIKGFSGYYAHWYVVMLVVIYAFLPLIAFIKKRVDYSKYEMSCVILAIWMIVGHYFDYGAVSWSLSSGYFMAYVLLGDIISSKLRDKTNNLLGIFIIIVGIGILAANHYILYYVTLNGGDYYNRLLNLYGAPGIVIASIVIFCGFSLLNIRKGNMIMKIMAASSYTVFLCHKLLLDLVSDNTNIIPALYWKLNQNLKILIPIEWFVLLIASLFFAVIFNACINRVVLLVEGKRKNV